MLKTLLYIVIILWILRRIGGFFFKLKVEDFVKKQQEQAQGFSQKAKRNTGDIFISKKDSGISKSDKIGGEYVDYEEID